MSEISGEELAAVAAALNGLAQQPQTAEPERIPAWRRAMREESVRAFERTEYVR